MPEDDDPIIRGSKGKLGVPGSGNERFDGYKDLYIRG